LRRDWTFGRKLNIVIAEGIMEVWNGGIIGGAYRTGFSF
jgi:hypothetical protein